MKNGTIKVRHLRSKNDLIVGYFADEKSNPETKKKNGILYDANQSPQKESEERGP